MTVNEKIKNLRKDAGISRTFLSQKLSIDYKRLYRIEENNARITTEELSKLAGYFNKKINYFFE